MKFQIGQQVKRKSSTGTVKVRTIRKIETPSKEWLKNRPGKWVWLYFEGQIGGFCSEDFTCN